MQPEIAMFKPYMTQEAIDNAVAVLNTDWIGEGPKVQEFEEALCSKFRWNNVLALNSGTAGLRLALDIAGVGPGDEVVTTAQTCTATNTPILEQYAVPVFADIQYNTGNIDPVDVARRITPRTKAIMCVHWGGNPCDLDELNAIGAAHGIPVIEDAAHALGALYKGVPIGRVSRFTMFSLQAIKQLTTVDGGLLATVGHADCEEGRIKRWFGIDRVNRVKQVDGYSHWNQSLRGFKMHMNDVSAAIGLGNLQHIDWILGYRHKLVRMYRNGLRNVPGVTLFDRPKDRLSGDWLFTMHVERRDDFCRMMADAGVACSVVHIRNDVHDIFGPRRHDLPVLDKYEKTYISIPLHNRLEPEDVEYIISCIVKGW